MILKLKRTPGLYILGFMASGKTTVGNAVADKLGWFFCDIDTEIEKNERKTINQIFEERGEAAFRGLERQEIRRRVSEIESGTPYVVALGGGASVQPENWELISNNGITIWLDCPIETVYRRLDDDTMRPLARDRDNLARLFEMRKPLYARADFRIEVDCDDVAEIVDRILKLPIL